jgi:hypothetical protein
VRLLLDTNVLVAAFVARGVCSELLEHCVRHHVVISSRPPLDELRDVLTRKFRQRVVDAWSAIRLLTAGYTLERVHSADEDHGLTATSTLSTRFSSTDVARQVIAIGAERSADRHFSVPRECASPEPDKIARWQKAASGN